MSDLIQRIQELQVDLDQAPPDPTIDPQTFLDTAHLLALSMNLYYAQLHRAQHATLEIRAQSAETELNRLRNVLQSALGIVDTKPTQAQEVPAPTQEAQAPQAPQAPIEEEQPEALEQEQPEPIEKLPEETAKRWTINDHALHAYLLLNKEEVSLEEILTVMKEQGWTSNSKTPKDSVHTVIRRPNSPLVRNANGMWILRRGQQEIPTPNPIPPSIPPTPLRGDKGTFASGADSPNYIREGPFRGFSAIMKIQCQECLKWEWVHQARKDGWPSPDQCQLCALPAPPSPDLEEQVEDYLDYMEDREEGLRAQEVPPAPTPSTPTLEEVVAQPAQKLPEAPPDSSWLHTAQVRVTPYGVLREPPPAPEPEEEEEPSPNPFSRKRPHARGNEQGWLEKRQQQYRHTQKWKKPTI